MKPTREYHHVLSEQPTRQEVEQVIADYEPLLHTNDLYELARQALDKNRPRPRNRD